MSGKRIFLDTNVLVYLFDTDEPAKQAVAKNIFAADNEIVISTQVIQEFYAVVTRKFKRHLHPESAYRAVQEFLEYSVAIIRPPLVSKAIRRSIDSRISLWDALIVETALYADAETLLTEDLNDGWVIEGMAIHNPF